MREHLEEFSAIRFGLRYGDENRRLVGALGRDPRQYALQFDTVTIDGVIVQGLDALLAFRERDIDACIRRFQGGGDSVGPNYAALEAIPDWSAVRDMHYGKFALMLDQSEDLYMEEAQDKIDSTVLTDRLINVFNCMLILILYVHLMHGCVRISDQQCVQVPGRVSSHGTRFANSSSPYRATPLYHSGGAWCCRALEEVLYSCATVNPVQSICFAEQLRQPFS